MILSEYPNRITRILTTPPAPGEGHRWMFRAALALRHYHSKAAVTLFLQRTTSTWSHRRVPLREVQVAVTNAFNAEGDGAPHKMPVDWWPINHALQARIVAETRPLFDYTRPTGIRADDCLRGLFQPADLVCLASDQANAIILPAASAGEFAPAAQFIVPTPMRGTSAVNQTGKVSVRCNANVAGRRHLVIECDGLGKPEQAAILSHLANALPLVMVVDSAGKSLHGWFKCEGLDEYTLQDFMTYAVGLGGDAHTWTRAQLVRCPGGTRYRDDGSTSHQAIVYWNHK